jgi:hypothetical protein
MVESGQSGAKPQAQRLALGWAQGDRKDQSCHRVSRLLALPVAP